MALGEVAYFPTESARPPTKRRTKDVHSAMSAGPKNSSSARLHHAAQAEANSAARIHRVRWGLSFKFALPVAILQALVLTLWGYVVLREVMDTQLNDIMRTGLSNVEYVVQRGRSLFAGRAEFFEKHPDYRKAPNSYAFPLRDHWLISSGQLSSKRWAEIADRKDIPALNEMITKAQATQVENNAALFSNMTRYSRDGEIRAGFVAEYHNYHDPDRRQLVMIASTDRMKNSPVIHPHVDWMGLGANSSTLEYIRIGDHRESVAPVEISQARLTWPDAPSAESDNVLQFQLDIRPATVAPGQPPTPIGVAVVTLRADNILRVRHTTTRLMLWAGAVALTLATGLCFLIGNRVTTPIRRILADMEIFSAGEMDHRTTAFSQDEIGLVAAEFNRMAGRLEIALGREKEAARMNTELETAREIQKNLLPPKVPFIRGYDVAVTYRPAREVGGDYYDFFPINDTHIGIIIADVSGKSIPGALVMSTTRTILRFVVPGNLSAADTLKRTNAVVAQDIRRGMFVSAFYLILDVAHRRALVASAGHNPLVVCRADGTIQTVSPGGIALGFDKGPIFNRTLKEAPLLLSSGDRVVMYTDGVVEAMNQKNEEYGDERFHTFVRNSLALSSREFVAALLADLDAHQGAAEQHDDITMVTFRVD